MGGLKQHRRVSLLTPTSNSDRQNVCHHCCITSQRESAFDSRGDCSSGKFVYHVCSQQARCLISSPSSIRWPKLASHRFEREGDTFLNRIIPTDESWTCDFELEVKSQSTKARHPLSPCTSKCCWQQSKRKQMIFACDAHGAVVSDRVPVGQKC